MRLLLGYYWTLTQVDRCEHCAQPKTVAPKAIWASTPVFAVAAEAQREIRMAAVAASIGGRDGPSSMLGCLKDSRIYIYVC